MLKIILTGPESCGKTTLARQLAAHFQVPLVEEYVREFFEKKGTPDTSGQAPQYQEADLKEIAVGQIQAEINAQKAVNQSFNHSKNSVKPKFMICDTDVLTIKIWSEEKYGRCDDWIMEQFQMSNFRFQMPDSAPSNFKLQTLYLLCSPEGIAWEADPLRENAHDRDRLFTIYEENLIFYQKNYQILRGSIGERFEAAKEILGTLAAHSSPKTSCF